MYNKFLKTMLNIFREISKLCILTILWGIPVLVSWMTQNYHYLWLFGLSLIATVGVLAHYEDIAKIEAGYNVDELPDNEDYNE